MYRTTTDNIQMKPMKTSRYLVVYMCHKVSDFRTIYLASISRGESWHGTPEALGFSSGWDDFLPPVTYGLSYNHQKKKKKIQ